MKSYNNILNDSFIKVLIVLIIINSLLKFNNIIKKNYYEFKSELSEIYIYIDYTFLNLINNKIKIGIYAYYLKNGGRSRITSLLLNYLSSINIFKLFLFSNKSKDGNEYRIKKTIKRISMNNYKIKNLIKEIKKKRIDIFIYQYSNPKDIIELNKIKNIKVIFYQHQSIFYWIYSNYTYFKELYKSYINSKYIISLINLESNYIFKKWGINSIFMNNFITYEYNSVLPSDLSSKIILMIGRANNRLKRFELGIRSMEYIIEEIKECKMKIISSLNNIDYLTDLVSSLFLEKNVKFYGYTSSPDIYFKNASLHIFPSFTESFGLVLSETKIYGIPSILVGLNYVSIANRGVFIIYDETPESIGKESIKILLSYKNRNLMGKEARADLKKFNNKLLLKKWIKMIFSIYYNNNYYYEQIKKSDNKINEKHALNMIKNQIKYIQKKKYLNITLSFN